MTLQRYLTRLIWLSILPVLALATWLGYARFAGERDAADARASRLAGELAGSLDHALRARLSALRVLAGSPLVAESRWRELHDKAQSFRAGFGGDILVVDAQQRMRLHTRVPFGGELPPLPRPAGRSAVQLAFESGGPAVGDPFHGPIAGETLVAMAVPVTRDERPVLVLAHVMPVSQLGALLGEPALPAGWSAAVNDSQGRVIVGRLGAPGERGSGEVEVVRFADRLTAVPWTLEVRIPRPTYVQHLARTGAALLLALAGVVGVSVLVGRRGKRRLQRSVRSLVDMSTAPDPVEEIDEFRDARRLLDESLSQRTAIGDALQVREAQLRGIFESASEAIITADAGQRIVLANPAAARIFGRPVDALVGAPLAGLMPERYRARHHQDVEDFGLGDPPGARAMGRSREVVGLRADGGEFPIEAAISQVHVDGQRLYTVILRDVSDRREAERSTAAARAQLEAAIESMNDGLVMIGHDGRIVELNTAFARMFGFAGKDDCPRMLGEFERLIEVRTLDGRRVPPSLWSRSSALRGGESATGVERRLRRTDTGRSWVASFSCGPIRDAQGRFLGVVMTVRDVTEQRRLEEQLHASHAELARLVAAQMTVEEEERKRIAGELHDELQQVLAAIKMDAGEIEAALADEPGRVPAIAVRIVDLAAAAITSSRRIVNDLRPLLLEELGLLPALEALARQFTERTGIGVSVEADERCRDEAAPQDAIGVCLYRVAQEALNNVAKHAGPCRVRLELSVPEGGGWRLEVIDDGRGMRPDDRRKPLSLGLRSMAERVRALGGSLHVDGAPAHGVRLSVEFGAAGAMSAA